MMKITEIYNKMNNKNDISEEDKEIINELLGKTNENENENETNSNVSINELSSIINEKKKKKNKIVNNEAFDPLDWR